jgi:GntR family transcriptional repressor for pyruvate dehydrogenase complex
MFPKHTISHEIAASLRTDILENRYRPDDKFPSWRDLAARFNASRGAVREGFCQLEQLGLIRIFPGGARVQPIETASLAVLGPMLELSDIPDPHLVDQFLETCCALASLTARSAVLKASQDELNQLHQTIVKLAKQTTGLESIHQQWRHFLEMLGNIADNLVVRFINNDLRAQFIDYMMSLGIKPEIPRSLAAKTLKALKTSIETRDAELASAAVQSHFDQLRIAAANAIEARQAEHSR